MTRVSEGTNGGVRKLPHYLSTTSSMEAKTVPTRKWVKRESRHPPRMVLRKSAVSPAVDLEEKEAVPAVSQENIAPAQATVPTSEDTTKENSVRVKRGDDD